MDSSKWPVVYPAYIDAAKTIALGRKLSKADAVPFKLRGMIQVMTQNGPMVIDKMAVDIAQACASLNIPGALEPKTYPRDILCRGRVRVRIVDEEGKPLREDIKNRRDLFLKLAAQIKINLAKAPPPQQQQQAPAAQKQVANAGAGGGGSKKKSKKKKK